MTRQGESPGDDSVLIGDHHRFEGLVAFRVDSRIDGHLVGEVVASGRLVLGPTATVHARIEVDELIVDGKLEGDVEARRRIELGPTARVAGRLRAPRLALADGCHFEGHCETGTAASGPASAP
jgi:cytoskeletal protein CcmA (bactofilin family)